MLLSFRVRAQTHDVKIRGAADALRLFFFCVCGVVWCGAPLVFMVVLAATLFTLAGMTILSSGLGVIGTNREHPGTLLASLRAFG